MEKRDISAEQWRWINSAQHNEEQEKRRQIALKNPEGPILRPSTVILQEGRDRKKEAVLLLKEKRRQQEKISEAEAKAKKRQELAKKKPSVSTFKAKNEPTVRQLLMEIRDLLTRPNFNKEK